MQLSGLVSIAPGVGCLTSSAQNMSTAQSREFTYVISPLTASDCERCVSGSFVARLKDTTGGKMLSSCCLNLTVVQNSIHAQMYNSLRVATVTDKSAI